MCVRGRVTPSGWFQTTRGEAGDARAERVERGLEQQVVLEAIAAAPVAHEFPLQRRLIEPNGPAQERVEILERDRQRVPKVERAQRLQRGRARTVVADAPEIAVEFDGLRHGRVPAVRPAGRS